MYKEPIWQSYWYEISPGTWTIAHRIIAYQWVPIPIGASTCDDWRTY